MKGFVPPPRLAVSNEPLPITRSITLAEGVSVKDLAEKLGVRAKDLIARLLMKGVMATVNQSLDFDLAKDLARHFGADAQSITFEEQAAQDLVAMTGATQESVAAAAAKCVTQKALEVKPSEANSLPALKPNQPTHSMAAPSTV